MSGKRRPFCLGYDVFIEFRSNTAKKKSCVGQNSDTSAFFTLSQRNNYFAGNTPNKRQRFLSAIKLSSHQWLIFGQLITRMKSSIFSSLKTIVQWSPLSALCGQHRINSSLAGKKWPPFWQTTLSNAISWIKMTEFLFEFHWNLFPWVR